MLPETVRKLKRGFEQVMSSQPRTLIHRNLEKLPGSTQEKRDVVRLFLIMLLTFAIFSHWVGYNENSRVNLTGAILEDGEISIQKYHNNTVDKALINDRYYSDKPPGSSLAAIPAYAAHKKIFGTGILAENNDFLKFMVVVSVSSIAGASTIVLLYLLQIELGMGRKKSLLLAPLLGFSSLIFPYSTTFHGRMLGGFILLLATYIWVRKRGSFDNTFFFIFPLLLGLGTSTAYPVAIPAFFFSLLLLRELWEKKAFTSYLVGGLLGLSPLMIYNTLIFGHPFDLAIFYNTIDPETAKAAEEALVNTAILEPRLIGVVILWFNMLFDPGIGLFWMFPVYVIGMLGMTSLWRKDRKLVVVAVASLFTTVLLISTLDFKQGAYFGDRILLPSSLLVLLGAGCYINSIDRTDKAKILLVSILLGLSIVFSFSSTQIWNEFETKNLGELETPTEAVMPISHHLQDYYLDNYASRGLQSPILSYSLGISPSLDMSMSPYPERGLYITEIAGTFFYYESWFVFGLIPFSLYIFLLREEIQAYTGFSSYAGIIVLFLLLLSGLQTTDSHYKDGWHAEKEGENVIWGREEPRIYLYHDAHEPKEQLLNLELVSTSKNSKNFSIRLNDDKIFDGELGPGKAEYRQVVELEHGPNKLVFDTDEPCNTLGEIYDNDDARCSTVGLSDLSTTTEDGFYLGSGISQTSDGYYIKEDASVFLKGGERSLEITGHTINGETDIEIEVKNKTYTASMDRFSSTYATPYLTSDSFTEVKIRTNCPSNCDRLELQRLEAPKYGEQPENLTYRLGRNWYVPVEGEDHTWSSGNASIYIYNQKHEPVERLLDLEARAFGEPANVTYYLNGEKLATETVSNYGNQNRYTSPVELKSGENILHVKSDKDCISKGDINNNNDIRCGLYGLRDLQLR